MKWSLFKVTAPTLPSNDFRAIIPISSDQDFKQIIKCTSGWVSFEMKKDFGILEEILRSSGHITSSSVNGYCHQWYKLQIFIELSR